MICSKGGKKPERDNCWAYFFPASPCAGMLPCMQQPAAAAAAVPQGLPPSLLCGTSANKLRDLYHKLFGVSTHMVRGADLSRQGTRGAHQYATAKAPQQRGSWGQEDFVSIPSSPFQPWERRRLPSPL